MKTYFLTIWPASGCNIKCRYCFYEESDLWDMKCEYMDTDVADAIIKFMNSGQVEGVSFFGGEPLVNWPIVKRILARTHLPYIMKDKSHKKSYYNITTNGTLLTPDVLEYLALHEVHINLSLDGTKETQDYWRGGSYDKIIENLDELLKYPSLQVLKCLSDPSKLYEDIKHIKDLGFKSMFINLLDPYSHYTYEDYDVEDFKRQYREVIKLNDESFRVADYSKWRDLIDPSKPKGIGCGFSNRGLCVDWKGNLWPCHQGPSLPDEFIIGDIWNGIDFEKEKKVRDVPNAPSCENCEYKLTKCYVSMYNKHGRFNVDPPKWHMDFEKAKIKLIEKINKFPGKCTGCESAESEALLLATLISKEKYYILKPFLESIMKLELPAPTDYYLLVDDNAKRIHHTLRLWAEGRVPWLPHPSDKFRQIKLLKIPTVKDEGFMWRITRGRNMVLGVARKNPEYQSYVFIDADIIAPPDTITKLDSVDAGIVGGLVRCRREDKVGWYNNYVKTEKGYESAKFEPGEVIEVDATGSDCLLIRRPVFIGQIYEFKPEIPEAEDMGFCFKATDRGFKVKIHTGVETKHIEIKDIEVVI